MCGDIDDDTRLDDEFLARLIQLSARHGSAPGGGAQKVGAGAAPGSGANYMTALFRDALTRALDDAAAAPEGARADTVAAQAIVFGRLAGFLCGQFPPQADLFRSAVEAFMDGHGEPARQAAEHHSHGHHHHGHDHEH